MVVDMFVVDMYQNHEHYKVGLDRMAVVMLLYDQYVMLINIWSFLLLMMVVVVDQQMSHHRVTKMYIDRDYFHHYTFVHHLMMVRILFYLIFLRKVYLMV
jgi:hypothetical protein